jgi:Zn-dependent peptidase ImmA (M78 family)/DNA-binding XRE family transcriptional regulator
MKLGTSGFVGAKLKEAREARGISATALAEILGISRQAVYQYEADRQTTPHPDIMDTIVQVVNLPHHFFLQESQSVNGGNLFYRSMSSATKSARVKAERKYHWFERTAFFVQQYISSRQPNFPEFEIPKNPLQISSEMIESLATKIRRFWELTDNPIGDLVRLIEQNGAIVSRFSLEADKLDAFSEWNTWLDAPMIVLGSDKNISVRSRFDIAHELGHLILHRNIDRKLLNKKSEFKEIEKQAHRFAGAFLMPATTFSNEIGTPTLDTFYALKTKWKVSIQAMAQRAKDLALIDNEEFARMRMNITRRGWRMEEPYDDELEVEQPIFLRESLELLVSEDVVTKEEIKLVLPFAESDIIDIAGLPASFFNERRSLVNVEHIADYKRQSQNKHTSSGKADLYDFKRRVKYN